MSANPETTNQPANSLSSFSADFLRRSMRMTALLLLVGALFVALRIDAWAALAFFSGGVWTLVNLIFLTAAVRTVVRPEGPDKFAAAGLLLIKFPALYVAGYYLLSFEKFSAVFLLIGFSVFFGVLVLKSLGRAILKMEDSGTKVKRQSVLR